MSHPTGKKAALKEFRALNPRPEAVTDEDFAACAFLDPDDVVSPAGGSGLGTVRDRRSSAVGGESPGQAA
ncbi:hypothetical protein A6P39_002815 [Streptomyces sp. FXJ1.172]|uniref:hypothetical protein n=1 Tax=Streptomyces sp. FXJ1.172 TaxID=710705 RepID=UPI000A727CA5|nr:hypothetical protein [Streptomyces sp. FXJ1.172]WEO93086.1 hypothetical protein A6P39_002815 [Streptomyces sp. FXJ1.172]